MPMQLAVEREVNELIDAARSSGAVSDAESGIGWWTPRSGAHHAFDDPSVVSDLLDSRIGPPVGRRRGGNREQALRIDPPPEPWRTGGRNTRRRVDIRCRNASTWAESSSCSVGRDHLRGTSESSATLSPSACSAFHARRRRWP